MEQHDEKGMAIILALIVIFSMTGCGIIRNSGKKHYLEATITDITDGSMLVTPVEGSPELKSSDSFSVPITKMASSPEPLAGDLVEITYNGDIQETYPAGLGGIESIKVIREK